MPGTYSQLLLHLVFSTKRREPWITKDIRPRVYDFMGGIVRAEKGVLIAIGGIEDHVHLLVRWRTDETIAYLLRNVKARSSLWIHKTFPTLRKFAWQEGYGAFTVSASKKREVERYILNQEAHHKKQTFKEEFIDMLIKHEVEYDLKHVFD